MNKLVFTSNSTSDTTALGIKIGECLEKGSSIALIGDLGCGKTLLTRGICQGLNVSLRMVNSPTFVLVNEYQGRMPVFHFDLYRLGDAPDVVELGITDYFIRSREGLMIIEWAEKILEVLPEDLLKIEFEIISSRKRILKLSASGDKYNAIFKELARK